MAGNFENKEGKNGRRNANIPRLIRKIAAITAFAALPILSESGIVPKQISSGPTAAEAQTLPAEYIELKEIEEDLYLAINVPLGEAKKIYLYDEFPSAYAPMAITDGNYIEYVYTETAPAINGNKLVLRIANPYGGVLDLPILVENGRTYVKIGSENEYVIAEDVKITGTEKLKETPTLHANGFASLNVPLEYALNDSLSVTSDMGLFYRAFYDNVNKVTEKELTHDINLAVANKEERKRLQINSEKEVVRTQAVVNELTFESNRASLSYEFEADSHDFEGDDVKKIGEVGFRLGMGYMKNKVIVKDPNLYSVAVRPLEWEIQEGETNDWNSEYPFGKIGITIKRKLATINADLIAGFGKTNKYQQKREYARPNYRYSYSGEMEFERRIASASGSVNHSSFIDISGYVDFNEISDYAENEDLAFDTRSITYGATAGVPLNPAGWGRKIKGNQSLMGVDISRSESKTRLSDLNRNWEELSEINSVGFTIFAKMRLGESTSLTLSKTRTGTSGSTRYIYDAMGSFAEQDIGAKPSDSYKISLSYKFGPISVVAGASGSKTKPTRGRE